MGQSCPAGERVALVQYCGNVSTASSTLAQQCVSVGSAPRVCSVSAEISHLPGEHEPLSGRRFWVGPVSWTLGQLLNGASQQTWVVGPTLVYCWPTVYEAGPTVNQRCPNVSCFLGCWVSQAPGKYPLLYTETLARCCFNTESVSVTLFRHWFSIGSVPLFTVNADIIYNYPYSLFLWYRTNTGSNDYLFLYKYIYINYCLINICMINICTLYFIQ